MPVRYCLCCTNSNKKKKLIALKDDESICICEDCIGICVEIIAQSKKSKPKLVVHNIKSINQEMKG